MTTKIQEYFIENELSLSTAESCTGGNIAHQITSLGGSSNYFLGTVVSYANTIKINVLNVRESDIKHYGVVSETVAVQLVQGILNVTNSSYAISTTGIAGPGGGSLDMPVGTVWIGVGNKQIQKANRYFFEGDRLDVIRKSTAQAIHDLEDFVAEMQSNL